MIPILSQTPVLPAGRVDLLAAAVHRLQVPRVVHFHQVQVPVPPLLRRLHLAVPAPLHLRFLRRVAAPLALQARAVRLLRPHLAQVLRNLQVQVLQVALVLVLLAQVLVAQAVLQAHLLFHRRRPARVHLAHPRPQSPTAGTCEKSMRFHRLL